MKTSVGFGSLSTRRWDEDCVKVTTSVLTLSDERVGLGGNDTESTTLTSLCKGRVGSTIDKSESRDNLLSLVGITYWWSVIFSKKCESSSMLGQRKVQCIALHIKQRYKTLPLRPFTNGSLVEGATSTWLSEVDNTNNLDLLEHSSCTWERPGHSLRR